MAPTAAHQVTTMWAAIRRNPAGSGPYYSIMRLDGDGMGALREMFPKGEADEMNAVLFSTSGIHGSYCLIEAVEEDMQRPEREGPREVTFCIIQPRIVCMRYGNARPETPEDIEFLKKLRSSSLRALTTIGVPSAA